MSPDDCVYTTRSFLEQQVPIPNVLHLMGSQLKEAGESHPSGMVIDFNKTILEPEREKVS